MMQVIMILDQLYNKKVAFPSRTLTETECRYAQIEKEMLAVTYGLEKFHHYAFGSKVHVVTDHKSLVAIANKPLPNYRDYSQCYSELRCTTLNYTMNQVHRSL